MISFSYFKVSSCLVFFSFFKFHHGWYLWNLTPSLKRRLHANIFLFLVASSHSFSKCLELNSTNSFIWSILSTCSGSASVSVGFLSVNSSLQTFTTQVVGSKVLYTKKYYVHVERFHLTPHRPKFTHITQEKALFKKHLF